MTDDQGWGETGYNNHPVLNTPNLDDMARNGLRFDRFYAAGPVCSPTRASVLTGRTHDRTGVYSHGYALRRQEKTVASALQAVGYKTGHFGKWHLNGLMGPGVPIFADDQYNPGVYGFDEWVSTSNFFDIDPIMSEKGEFKQYTGTSSEVIVQQAINFIDQSLDEGKPFFAVVWDGSPHNPWLAKEEDKEAFANLNSASREHYGELVAFDKSVGELRAFLKAKGLADNTLVWFCSDNGGLPDISPTTVANLRGYKGSLYEGGIRVPAIIEWPARVQPSVTGFPASTMDIFATLAEVAGLPDSLRLYPQDGTSILPVLSNVIVEREKPIFFRFEQSGALVDNNFKLFIKDRDNKQYELYNLQTDPGETNNLATELPDRAEQMTATYEEWNESVDNSIEGYDYPEKKVIEESQRRFWMNDPRYEKYLNEWSKRWEYKERIEQAK
jgi:arylsulfatase A-like enzyme